MIGVHPLVLFIKCIHSDVIHPLLSFYKILFYNSLTYHPLFSRPHIIEQWETPYNRTIGRVVTIEVLIIFDIDLYKRTW